MITGSHRRAAIIGRMWLPDPLPLARDAVEALGPWAYVLVAAVVLLETSVGLGLLSPGEAVIAVAGAAAADGTLDPVLLVVVVLGFGVAGDSLSWALGGRYGRGVLPRLGRRVGLTPARIDRIAERVADDGMWVLVAGRFVGPVRVLAPFLIGTSGVPYRRFLPYDVAGIALWAGAWLAIGWVFAGALGAASGWTAPVGLAVLLTASAVALAQRRRATPGRADPS